MSRPRSPILLALLPLAWLWPASAEAKPWQKPKEPPQLAAVRKLVAEVDALINKKQLSVARITIGGGQNAARYLIHYAGGSQKDYEKDPYASPFHLRRVRREITLPAVGDAAATIYYNARGEPVFIYTTGADTMGVKQLQLHPASQLRAYFQGRQLVRISHTGARDAQDEADQTIDLAAETDARRKANATAAGAALLLRAETLRDALKQIAE